MVDMKQEVQGPLLFCQQPARAAVSGVEVSKPMAKKTTVFSGFTGDAQAWGHRPGGYRPCPLLGHQRPLEPGTRIASPG